MIKKKGKGNWDQSQKTQETPIKVFGKRRLISFLLVMKVLVVLIFLLSPGIANAQWANTYGGPGDEGADSIQQTTDGGYIVAGGTNSFGAGGNDFWVLKLNPDGTVAWQKTYGGPEDEEGASSIQQTRDGGYIVAGGTTSFGAVDGDSWVLKLHPNGTVAWQRTYGGTGDDIAGHIQQTSDGGYIMAGGTNSFGAGGSDFWVLKLNPFGGVAWQKTYGGTGDEGASSIQQTTDGGYIVAGETNSFGAGGRGDFWVLKLNPDGTVDWERTYGGESDDYAFAIRQTSDGGYIVAGVTYSFGTGGDIMVLKLNPDGTVAWQKTYGGSDWDWAYSYSIWQTTDGGYIVAGETKSFGAGNTDILILKLDASGNIVWQRTYGGGGFESASPIQQTTDGGYIVAGRTDSFGAGGRGDFWVLKLDVNGEIPDCAPMGTSSAVANNINVSTSPSSATVTLTSASSSRTNATVTDTHVTAGVVCQVIRPDLVVSRLTTPFFGRTGREIRIVDTKSNNGTIAAATSRTGFYLSTDTTLDPGDTRLGERAVPALSAGASSTGTTWVTIPPGTAPGTYYIIARADDNDDVTEINENNNERFRVIRIR